jgi:cytochrome c1
MIRNLHLAALASLLAIAFTVLAGCEGGQIPRIYHPLTGGVASRGKKAIMEKHCGAWHTIPGIPKANGLVGPPLLFFSRRTYIAGELPNTPANLVKWIRNPHSVEPGTAMPDLGLTEKQAQDVAAYLYTLR